MKKNKRILNVNASRLTDNVARLKPGGSWRSNKTSSTARGYNYEWQRYRADFIAAHPLCAIRGAGCTLATTVVDHVIPHRGDAALFWNPANHQSACDHCHNTHKQRQERKAQR
jgi:HNH endonuclease.